MGKQRLTAERLRNVLHYNPETGVFTNAIDRHKAKAGAISGKTHCSGYRIISIDGQRYGAHRLAFLYMTGELPEMIVDHIDRDPGNNRFVNLRLVTASGNAMNRSAQRQKAMTKQVGVYWRKREQRWVAGIRVDGVQRHLGYFDREQDAAEAYGRAKARHHQIESYEAHCG